MLEKRIGERLVSDEKISFVMDFIYTNGSLLILEMRSNKENK